MTTLEATITAVATRCLRGTHAWLHDHREQRDRREHCDGRDHRDRCNHPTIDLDTPLELLGLDSLATIELAAALENELGCALPPDLLVDCTDARTLAARLAPLASPVSREGRVDDPFDQMMADAVLPDDIQPARRSALALADGRAGLRCARTILLTGATGFLGAALLDELLDTSHATIVCLVRPTSPPIRRRGIGRVRTVTGDLSQPRLGLSASQYEALAREVDAVCHAGAAVNWVFSYATLRAPNVLGTLELLRLACRAGVAFHFISSLSTCYSTSGPRTADEDFDPLSALRGIHLGYAQTKVVGEALTREAGARGLPVRIYRPALIAGHSVTGAFNRDDLLSALVRGCVHMGTAPDLDWKLDCEPVDIVAKAIIDLSASAPASASAGTVFHLSHARPRHWRECVLWMRMYGYHVRLVSYHAWLRALERATAPGAAGSGAHPLRPLRSFFLDRPAGAQGLTMPELYEECRRTRAESTRTHGARSAFGATSPDLSATLLETYFAAFRAAGDLPDPPAAPARPPAPAPIPAPAPASASASASMPTPATSTRTLAPARALTPMPALRVCANARAKSANVDGVFDARFLSRVIGVTVRRVDLLGAGSDHSIVSELTAWRSKRPTGLFRARLVLDDGPRDVVIKIKARDTDVMAVGTALADLVDPAVGRAYRRHIARSGFAASDAREIAIYQQTDPRVTAHLPRVLGTVADASSETWFAVLEDVRGATLLDSVDRPEDWGAAEIAAAIDGLATLHAVWLDRDDELSRKPWIGHVPTTSAVVEMTDLWRALADHAAPYFSAWADPDIAQIHHRLVATVRNWWPPLDAGPRTLIHHDFNPRNVCLRAAPQDESAARAAADPARAMGAAQAAGAANATGATADEPPRLRLCAYDWELATVGAPQRDLAEFLCFVLTDTTTAHATQWIERHRVALERASGRAIGAEPWLRGFRSALCDVLINRFAMYAVVHRVRRQSFLPRVVRTWRQLYRQFAPHIAHNCT